ncbi:MAG: sterol desaturase family protein [Bacteroidota bacterium]
MEPERAQLFPYFVGIYVLAIALEAGYAAWQGQKGRYDRKDTWVNIFSGIGSALAGKLFLIPIFVIYEGIYQLTPLKVEWVWWAVPFALLCNDFLFYWAHRWSHTTHIGWATHVTHHSSLKYNLSVAVRQSWTQSFFFWVFLPMAVLGIPPEMVLLVKSIDGFYQFWIHTEQVKRLPRPIEFIFNTPSHHRVHHSSNPRYLDKNYGGILILWDRLFGTFQPELDEERCVYGLTKNIRSHNLLVVQFHVWGDILRRLVKARSLGAVWRTIYNAPGKQDDNDLRPPRPKGRPAVKAA